MRIMSNLGRLLALVAGLLVPALPALAVPTETALLAKYEGTWKGKGTVSGPNPGTVVCRLTFKTATSGKLNYSGRCSKRFLASLQIIAPLKLVPPAPNVFIMTPTVTTRGKASSTMTLGVSLIKLSFKLVDNKGQTTASSISFVKS